MSYESNKCFTLANKTSTGATAYYPSESGLEMTGKTVVTFFGSASVAATTVTVEASLAPTGTTKEWVDITKLFKNLNSNSDGAASFVLNASSAIAQLNGINVEHIRFKCVEVNTSVLHLFARVM
jgi:formylmethanofuran dehydrogenase subunit E